MIMALEAEIALRLNKVEEYRQRAVEAEKLAEIAATEHDRRHYLQLAISYRLLAERRAKNEKAPPAR